MRVDDVHYMYTSLGSYAGFQGFHSRLARPLHVLEMAYSLCVQAVRRADVRALARASNDV